MVAADLFLLLIQQQQAYSRYLVIGFSNQLFAVSIS
jgi:hypothetical protein